MANKTFYYKVASFVPDAGNLTLQDYLRSVYSQAPKPGQRKQKVPTVIAGEDSKERNVIGYKTEHKDMLCGVLQHYKEGAPVMVSVHSDDDDNYSILQYPPPAQTDAKKKAEFVKSLLYFAVRGNHLIYIQSRGVDSADLESHLNWLLGKFSNLCSPADLPTVFLEDNIPVGYRDQAPRGVKSITLFSEPQAVARKNAAAETDSGDIHEWAIDDDPLIEGFLNTLRKKRPGASKDEIFKLEDAYKKGSLRAKVTLNFVDQGKGEGSPLDSAAHILRHVQDLPFEMTLPHKEPLKSIDSKITRTYNVTVKDELLVLKSAFDKMAEMLAALVKSKDILPDPS